MRTKMTRDQQVEQAERTYNAALDAMYKKLSLRATDISFSPAVMAEAANEIIKAERRLRTIERVRERHGGSQVVYVDEQGVSHDTPHDTVYVVERDCCRSGNCFTCRDQTPDGESLRIVQERTTDLARAKLLVANWVEHNATILKMTEGDEPYTFAAYDILQIKRGEDRPWLDFKTLRTEEEGRAAVALVDRGVWDGQRVDFRIVRQVIGKGFVTQYGD